MSKPNNLTIFRNTNRRVIGNHLAGMRGMKHIHCTNGTYMPSADVPYEKIIATLLVGFRFVVDRYTADFYDSLVLAINSDDSMMAIYHDLAKKAADKHFETEMIERFGSNVVTQEDWFNSLDEARTTTKYKNYVESFLDKKMQTHQNMHERAETIAVPLAREHPKRKLAVIFYDEATPIDLYRSFAADKGLIPASLHKWGYGLDSKGPKIEGAEFFADVLGFPLPKDGDQPLCHDLTVSEDQRKVQVFDLTQEKTPTGDTYINKAGRVTYPISHGSNRRFGAHP